MLVQGHDGGRSRHAGGGCGSASRLISVSSAHRRVVCLPNSLSRNCVSCMLANLRTHPLHFHLHRSMTVGEAATRAAAAEALLIAADSMAAVSDSETLRQLVISMDGLLAGGSRCSCVWVFHPLWCGSDSSSVWFRPAGGVHGRPAGGWVALFCLAALLCDSDSRLCVYRWRVGRCWHLLAGEQGWPLLTSVVGAAEPHAQPLCPPLRSSLRALDTRCAHAHRSALRASPRSFDTLHLNSPAAVGNAEYTDSSSNLSAWNRWACRDGLRCTPIKCRNCSRPHLPATGGPYLAWATLDQSSCLAHTASPYSLAFPLAATKSGCTSRLWRACCAPSRQCPAARRLPAASGAAAARAGWLRRRCF